MQQPLLCMSLPFLSLIFIINNTACITVLIPSCVKRCGVLFLSCAACKLSSRKLCFSQTGAKNTCSEQRWSCRRWVMRLNKTTLYDKFTLLTLLNWVDRKNTASVGSRAYALCDFTGGPCNGGRKDVDAGCRIHGAAEGIRQRAAATAYPHRHLQKVRKEAACAFYLSVVWVTN